MPKIVRFYQVGGPEQLKLEESASRPPGAGEVKLRVQAVGLNRGELMYLHGQYLEPTKPPSRIGYEAAGIVEAVGPNVDKSWIGKRVSTIPGFSMARYGVLGEEAIVLASSLGEYPAELSTVQAAAIWMQYMTAYGAIVAFGNVQVGDTVVIPAASSSVGLAALQIVKGEGATVIATTRTSKKRDELMALGADHVIATDEEDLVKRVKELTSGKGARLTFDPVAGPAVEQLAEAASNHGIIFEYGALSMQPTPFPLMPALMKGLTIRGYTLMEITSEPRLLEPAKRYIHERLKDGRFKPKIAKTFPLAQVVEAYKYMESNEQVGKVVITVE